MFRIESYITPIIWSYFSKYVKNFNSHDFQVSLWQGGAIFSNLELNLEVLDSELQLPLTCASGHIQELKLTVPWRKITSEPIVLNVKSMELVLKYREVDMDTKTNKTPEELNTYKVRNVENAGYMRSLISKIVTNVRVNFENVVIKYVESDIVFSVNVGEASLTVADKNWKATFVEEILGGPDFVLRKKLSFSDVNICLDRCNNAGMVDKFHDPMLYRCDFDVRILQKFGGPLFRAPYFYRMDLFLGHLQFCVTDEQIPMLARLYNLFTWLMQSGNLDTSQSSSESTPRDTESEHVIQESSLDQSVEAHEQFKESVADENQVDANTGSWTSWAAGWLFSLPTAMFGEDVDVDEEEEEDDESFQKSSETPILLMEDAKVKIPVEPRLPAAEDRKSDSNAPLPPQTTHFGVYIKTLTIIFKAVQRSCDKPVSRRKIINIFPFLKCSIQGICCDFILRGNENSHSLGVSSIMVHGLGYCPCGVQDCSSYEGVPSQGGEGYFEAGQIRNDLSIYSLFQPEENVDVPEWCYDVNHKECLNYEAESNLLNKTPAFFLKYIVTRCDTVNAEDTSKVQTPEIREILYHCVAAPCKILLCSGLIHRLKMINEAIIKYRYEPYGVAPPSSSTSSFGTAAYGVSTPITIYRLVIRQPLIEIMAADHPSDYSHEKRGEYFRQSGGMVNPTSLARLSPAWPKMVVSWDILELTAEDMDGHFVRVKNRLVEDVRFEPVKAKRSRSQIQGEDLAFLTSQRQKKHACIQFSAKEVLVTFASDTLELNFGFKSACLDMKFSNYHFYNASEVLQKVEGNISLESVTCSTRLLARSNVLWLPFTARFTSSLLWEPNLLNPSIALAANLDSFNVFIGPETLIAISQLTEKLSVYLQEFLPRRLTQQSVELKNNRPTLCNLLFKDNFKKELLEHLLLRDDTKLPEEPSKVGICTANQSLVWKYLQKRTIVAVNLFPLSLSLDKNCNEEVQIKLELEYFSEFDKEYHHFYSFTICQGITKNINFNDDPQHNVISSTIWRIRFVSTDFQSEPLLLDSLPLNVEIESMHHPELTVAATMANTCINLVNHTFYAGKGIGNPVLQNYWNTDGVSPEDHVMGTISLEQCRFYYAAIENVSRCNAEFKVLPKILNYESLVLEEMSEPVFVRMQITCPDSHGNYALQVVTDNVCLKIGASLIHGAMYSGALWSQVINAFDPSTCMMMTTEKQTKIILNRVLVCNDLNVEIQVDSPKSEGLGVDKIPSKDCKAVSCPYPEDLYLDNKQQLTISCKSIANLEIDIHKSGYTGVEKNGKIVFVKVSNLSASQRLIVVSGSLLLANGLDHDVEFSVLPRCGTAVVKVVVPSRGVAPTYLYKIDEIEHFRFRLVTIGSPQNPWSNVSSVSTLRIDKRRIISSGVVELFEPNELTVSTTQARISIICEELDGKPRYLVSLRLPLSVPSVLISSVYCLRSWLCGETFVHLWSSDEKFKDLYSVKGKGDEVQMKFSAGQKVSHFMKFQSSLKVPPTMTPVSLLPAHTVEDKYKPVSIDEILSQISQNSSDDAANVERNMELQWPFINENISKSEWNTEINPETEVLISFSPWIEGLPTVVAEIRPWALFINLSGVELLFAQESQDKEWDQFWVPYKGVFSPKRIPIPKGRFRLGIMMNDFLVKSPPLQFSDQPERLNVKKINKDCKVPIDCYSRLDLFGGSQLACLTIETRVRNRMLIMTVRPTYAIQNRAPFQIYAAGITIASAIPQRRESWTDARLSFYSTLTSFTTNEKTDLQDTAVPILHFSSDGQDYCVTTPSYKYLALSCGGPWWFTQLVDCSEISRVTDGIPGTKVAVTLPKVDCTMLSRPNRHKLKGLKVASEPVVVGSYTKHGQVWISVSQDNAPQLMLHNKTSLPLLFTEKEVSSEKPRLPTSCFEQYLLLPPMSACHFSFCNAYNIFPQLNKKELPMPDLLLARVSQDLVDFVASHTSYGLATILERSTTRVCAAKGGVPSGTLLFPDFDLEWQKILNVNNNPMQYAKFGETSVKISVEIVGYTHHVFIEYARVREVSAKAIRSRFFSKNGKDMPLPKCQLSELSQHGDHMGAVSKNDKKALSNGSFTERNGLTIEDDSPLTPDNEFINITSRSTRPWRVKVFISELYLSMQDNFENGGGSDKEFLGLAFEPIIVEQVPIIEDSKLRPVDCPRRESWIYAVRVGSMQIDTPSLEGRRPCEFAVVLESIKKNPKIKYNIPETGFGVSRFMDAFEIPSTLSLDSTITVTRVAANEVNLETVWLRVMPFSLYIEDRLITYVMPSIQNILNVFNESYIQLEKCSASTSEVREGGKAGFPDSAIMTHVSIVDSGVPSENPSLLYADHDTGAQRKFANAEPNPMFLRAICFAPTIGSSSSGLNSSSSSVVSSSLSNLRLASVSPPPPSPMTPLEPHGSSSRSSLMVVQTISDTSVSVTSNKDESEDDTSDPFIVKRVSVPKELIQLFEQLSRPVRLKMVDIQGVEIELTLRTEKLVYVALDRSTVQLRPFKAFASVTTDFHLGLDLIMHYTMGTIFTIGNPVRVLGSLELLGSPGTLARTVGTGLRDLVVYPYVGILNGPVGFASGLGYGVTSLVRSVTSGSLVSLTNWAESVSRNIDRLTLDQQEQLISEAARQVQLQGFSDGFVQGLSGFGIRILGAIGGLSHHPIQNVIERGPSTSSVIGGVSRGVIGAVVKPIGGVAELISMTGQGLLLATGWKPRPKAKRPKPKRRDNTAASSAKSKE